MQLCWILPLLVSISSGLAAQHLQRDEIVSRCLRTTRDELEPCLIKLINEVQPRFAEGLPEFAVPRTEAVFLGTFDFSERSNNQNFVDGTFMDVTLKGFHEMQLKDLKLDYNKRVAMVKIFAPDLFASGRYVVNASIALIPLIGKSTFWLKLEQVEADIRVIFDFPKNEQDGDHHFVPVNVTADFDYQNITLHLNRLGDGNDVIRAAAQTVVQQNSRELMSIVKPALIRQLVKVVLDIAKDFGGTLTLEEMAGVDFIKEAFHITT